MNIEIDRQNQKIHLTHKGRPVRMALVDEKGKVLKKYDNETVYGSVVKKAISELMWKISNRRIA